MRLVIFWLWLVDSCVTHKSTPVFTWIIYVGELDRNGQVPKNSFFLQISELLSLPRVQIEKIVASFDLRKSVIQRQLNNRKRGRRQMGIYGQIQHRVQYPSICKVFVPERKNNDFFSCDNSVTRAKSTWPVAAGANKRNEKTRTGNQLKRVGCVSYRYPLIRWL